MSQRLSLIASAVLFALPALAALSPYNQRTAEMQAILDDKTVTKIVSGTKGHAVTAVVDGIWAVGELRRGGVNYAVLTGGYELEANAVYDKPAPGVIGPQPFHIEAGKRFSRARKAFTPAPSALPYAGRAVLIQAVLQSQDLEALITDPKSVGATGRISTLSFDKEDGKATLFTVVSGKCTVSARVVPIGKLASGDIEYGTELPKVMVCK